MCSFNILLLSLFSVVLRLVEEFYEKRKSDLISPLGSPVNPDPDSTPTTPRSELNLLCPSLYVDQAIGRKVLAYTCSETPF